MILTIVAPGGTLCDTTTDRVSFPGTVGRFTVLKGHAPLIAGLGCGEIVYAAQGTGEEVRLPIRSGCVRVCADRIEACVEPADTPANKEEKKS